MGPQGHQSNLAVIGPSNKGFAIFGPTKLITPSAPIFASHPSYVPSLQGLLQCFPQLAGGKYWRLAGIPRAEHGERFPGA